MPKITQSKPNSLKALDLRLKELEGVQAKTGWFESAKYEDGTPVAYVAALNELGHGSTPPRPFMRPTSIAEKDKWAEIAAKGAKEIVRGNATAFDVMDMLGLQSEGDVSKTISQVFSPQLSPITIELRAMKKADPDLKITKGIVESVRKKVSEAGYQAPTGVSVKPLNDSGFMIATLTHVTEQTS